MMNGYREIIIKNDSGATASYAVFCEAPTVEPAPPSGSVSVKVISSLRRVTDTTGEATCRLPRNGLMAVCGTCDDDGEDDDCSDVGVSVLDRRPVSLSRQNEDGSHVPGSLLSVDIDDGCLGFAKDKDDALDADKSVSGCFFMETASGFTVREAKDERYIIGVGTRPSSRSSRRAAPYYAGFTPAPATTYRIKPSQNYYVAVSSAPCGSTVTPQMMKWACKLDFDNAGSDLIQIRHTNTNSLVVWKGDRNLLYNL